MNRKTRESRFDTPGLRAKEELKVGSGGSSSSRVRARKGDHDRATERVADLVASDMNELCWRVSQHNSRIKKLLGLNAPEVIIRNETRMLQESVDALCKKIRLHEGVSGSNDPDLMLIKAIFGPGQAKKHTARPSVT